MEKLFTEKDYSDMAVKANAEKKKLVVVQKEIEYQVEVPEYEKKLVEVEIYDEQTGEPTGETKTVEVDDLTKPIMVQEEIENPETGEKELVTVQKHHTETRTKVVKDLELIESDTRALKLKSELAALDEKAIRSIRAILSETATDEDKTYLATLETKAQDIRTELAKIKE